MSFKGSAPLLSSSELSYFPGLTQPNFNWGVGSGLLTISDTSGESFQSIFTVNASGAETDNVYTGMSVGNVAGGATAILVGFGLDATHYCCGSPGSFSDPGFINRVEIKVQNGGSQQVLSANVSPHIPYNTASQFLAQYMAVSGTSCTIYMVNQSTGLLTALTPIDVSSVVSAATLQTWSAGMYFDGNSVSNISIKNLLWGPISDLSPITVPNVVGLTQAAAQTAIIAAQLTVGSVSFQVSGTVPAGDVISQSPAAGAQANIGDPVSLVIAIAPSVTIYGKFAPAPVFPPVMVLSSGLIEPRVWMPKENITVKT